MPPKKLEIENDGLPLTPWTVIGIHENSKNVPKYNLEAGPKKIAKFMKWEHFVLGTFWSRNILV
jgi:hypothetical protein